MSDGNFNRALLPHTPYASGLKMGQTMARQKAIEAFDEWITQAFPNLSDEERKQYKDEFERKMKREKG